MNRRPLVPLALLVLTLGLLLGGLLPGSGAFAAEEVAPEEVSVRPLDARLSGYEYPYPVGLFEISAQRQKLEMAYMDVPPAAEPEGAQGEGAGAPPTVLLLHGKNFSGAYWQRTIEALTARGVRAVVPDQIGFGKSSKPESFQFTFHALASHTAALLDHLGVERVIVVGHSMGGMLATRFALLYPQRVERLVLVNPIGLEDWSRKVPYVEVETWYQAELKKDPQKVKGYMQKSYFDDQWRPAYDPLVEIQAGWAAGPDADRLAWVSALTYDMIFTQPVVYEFPQLTMPTLLIIGQRDRTALGRDRVRPEVAKTLGQYPELGRRTAETIPGAELVELEGVGHVPPFEAFERYWEALWGFLAP